MHTESLTLLCFKSGLTDIYVHTSLLFFSVQIRDDWRRQKQNQSESLLCDDGGHNRGLSGNGHPWQTGECVPRSSYHSPAHICCYTHHPKDLFSSKKRSPMYFTTRRKSEVCLKDGGPSYCQRCYMLIGGNPCGHYVYSELLCEEWLSRLGSVLAAVLWEASEVVPKPPPPVVSVRNMHIWVLKVVSFLLQMWMPTALRCWTSAGWLFSLTNVAIRLILTALDCVDHVVQFVPWCFFFRVHQLLPEGVTRSDINWDVV